MSENLSKFQMSLLHILDVAIKIDGATKGDIQLFNRALGGLQIVAQRGFDPSFLQLFQLVRVDDPSACGRAFRYQRRVIIPDITTDSDFNPYLSIANASGFRAVQSTPIIAEDGQVKGVFSTHFANVHQLSDEASEALDNCASKMAQLITEHEIVMAQA